MAYEFPGTEPCHECGCMTFERDGKRWCPNCEPGRSTCEHCRLLHYSGSDATCYVCARKASTTDPVSAKLAELDALERAATPGPWFQSREEFDDHDAMAAAMSETIRRGHHVMHFMRCLSDPGAFPALTGNGPTSKANAALIVAARNAMPVLIEIAKACHEAIDDLDGLPDQPSQLVRESLLAALAKLVTNE